MHKNKKNKKITTGIEQESRRNPGVKRRNMQIKRTIVFEENYVRKIYLQCKKADVHFDKVRT